MDQLQDAGCTPNIGLRQRRWRLVGGALATLAGATLLAALVATDAPRWSRVLVALPFWAGAIGILQHKERTCVHLASRGLRDLGDGLERMDGEELLAVREQARSIHRRAFVATVVYTVAALLIP
jgi:hypothetical protein